MTIGQRISDKRKELGLSQEALGEKLGVSRQSIYKWESDTSLPDIDKLIALSRLFGVSVGWLLGVEEDVPSPAAEEAEQADWNAHQEQLIEEVLKRYQAAQPKPKKSAWEMWSVRILAFTCGALLVSILVIRGQLNELSKKYNTLNASLTDISAQTSMDLEHMADRMTARLESVLKSQSELAVDYDCEVLSFDLLQETITFSLNIVPKTYTQGMSIFFQANSGGEIVEIPALQISSQTFSGELTCPLTDTISVSAVFQTGDVRQMQLLNEYDELYTGTLPDYQLNDTAQNNKGAYQSDGSYTFPEQYVYLGTSDDLNCYKTDLGSIEISSFEVGLFQNKKLVQWLEPSSRPSRFAGTADNGHESWSEYFHDGFSYFHSPQTEGLALEDGDELFFAARVTDEFGRVTMIPAQNRYTVRNGQLLCQDKGSGSGYADVRNYQF